MEKEAKEAAERAEKARAEAEAAREAAAKEAAEAEASLPSGWKTAKHPDGRTYYYHAATKKTMWRRPTEGDAPADGAAGAAAAANGSGGGEGGARRRAMQIRAREGQGGGGLHRQGGGRGVGPLPAGWKRAQAPDGRTYYCASGEKTRWARPTAPRPARQLSRRPPPHRRLSTPATQTATTSQGRSVREPTASPRWGGRGAAASRGQRPAGRLLPFIIRCEAVRHMLHAPGHPPRRHLMETALHVTAVMALSRTLEHLALGRLPTPAHSCVCHHKALVKYRSWRLRILHKLIP